MRRAAVLAALAAVSAATGCGSVRTPVPDLSHPDVPRGTRTVELRAAGIRFTAPANWGPLSADGQRAGGIQSKTATLAVWRYPRTEPLPLTPDDLAAAKDRLEQRVRERDPAFEVRSSVVTTRAGADALEVTGFETIGGRRVGVRSSHVFKDAVEVVVDAYAPPGDFSRVDGSVFQPVLQSLQVEQP